jgi:hypothetical protein
MSPAAMLATAAVVGAAAGAVAAAVVAGPFGLRDRAAVTATIVLTPQGGDCAVRTLPNALVVGKRDLIQWNIVGSCSGITLANVELQYMGACASKGTNPLPWTVFTDNANPKGPKMRRTIAVGDEQCLAYRVWHVDRALEDPELEIVQF